MVDPEAVNAERAAAFLAERYGGSATSVEHLGTGAWSKAFAFQKDAQQLVIRFGALREDFDKDALAARYAAPGLPVPRVLEVGEAATVGPVGEQIGGYYAVSERLPGAYIDHVDVEQMRSLLPDIFRALDDMRDADISHTSGYGLWTGDGNAPGTSWRAYLLDVASDTPVLRTHGWRTRLEQSAVGTATFDAAYHRLETLAASLPEDRHLIHSDLLHLNVLVEGPRITGVLDWGCGLYGDFLYDLAWFCFWGPWYTAWDSISFEEEGRRHYQRIGLNVPTFAERLLACQLHIALGGLAYQAFIGDWDNFAWTVRRTQEIAGREIVP